MKKPRFYLFALILTAMLLSVSCAPTTEVGQDPSGNLAFVDLVAVEMQGDHFYAKVEGHYPDACSRVSKIDQFFDGSTFMISLYLDRPEDMMCAQILSPFKVLILLEVGGVTPGEYTVDVNERSDSFTLGP